jgi:hypothetical protein
VGRRDADAWDTDADATAFEGAATTALSKAQGSAKGAARCRRQDSLGRRRQRRRDPGKVANALGLAG